MSKMSLGKRIGEARKNKNLTQEVIAEKLGVTRQTISNWELDRAEPSLDMLKELSDLLEIDIFNDYPTLNKENIIIDNKLVHIIYFLQVALTIFYISGLIFKGATGPNILMSVILLICSTVVYIVFEYALKNNDYTMIAGYNRNAKYDIDILRGTVISIELNILIQGLVTAILYMVVTIFTNQEIMNILIPIILIAYMINVILISIYINYKNSQDLYKYKQSTRTVKWYGIIFLFEILILIISTIICFVKYNIENNTIPALKIGGIILMLTGLSTANFFMGQKKSVNETEQKNKYKLSLISYLVILINIIGILFIFYIGSSV